MILHQGWGNVNDINLRKAQKRPPFEKWYPYIYFAFLGYIVADLAILSFRDRMLPSQPPPARPQQRMTDLPVGRSSLNTIITRNIFTNDGIIPAQLVAQGDDGSGGEREAAPVPSQLPMTLIGTLVHSNPDKSIATIETKNKGQVLSYIPGKEIEGIATLVSVERLRVIIRNSNNNRLEYIEMKETGKINLNVAAGSKKTTPNANNEVKRISDTQFAIKRADLNKYLSNLNDILQQAASQPNRDPVTGEINGYKILRVEPNSIFSQLNIQPGDVISNVGGEPIDSPAKALELFNALKNSAKINLGIIRNGRPNTYEYSIQ